MPVKFYAFNKKKENGKRKRMEREKTPPNVWASCVSYLFLF